MAEPSVSDPAVPVTAKPAKSAPVASAPAPITLADFITREPRLVNRPEMTRALVGAAARAGLTRATPEAFAGFLNDLETGAR